MIGNSKRRPSAAMAVALLSLFVAMGGSAYAVSQIDGAKLKNRSVSAKKIKKHTLTGSEIDMSKLGIVPTAVSAFQLGRVDQVVNGPVANGGTCPTLAPGAINSCIAMCPPGEVAISGGGFMTTVSDSIFENGPIAAGTTHAPGPGQVPAGWAVGFTNFDSVSQAMDVYVLCAHAATAHTTGTPSKDIPGKR